MKIKIKKIKKIFGVKLTRFRVVSFCAVILMGIFAGGTVVAAEIHDRQLDARMQKQEISLTKELENAKKLKAAKAAGTAAKNAADAETPKSEVPVETSEQPAAPKPAATSPQKTATPAPAPAPKPGPATEPAKPTALETSTSVAYINTVRSTAGKSALTQNSTMDGWALAHAKTLASACQLYHQSLSGFLSKSIGPVTVSSIAENIGYAGTTPAVLDALKNSPGHYANMTGDHTYVGIGVVKAASGTCAGYVYTTQLFAK